MACTRLARLIVFTVSAGLAIAACGSTPPPRKKAKKSHFVKDGERTLYSERMNSTTGRWKIFTADGTVLDTFRFGPAFKGPKRPDFGNVRGGHKLNLRAWRIVGDEVHITTYENRGTYRFGRKEVGKSFQFAGTTPDGTPVRLTSIAPRPFDHHTVKPSKNPTNLGDQLPKSNTSTPRPRGIRCPSSQPWICGNSCCAGSTCCGGMCWSATRSCPWGSPRHGARRAH